MMKNLHPTVLLLLLSMVLSMPAYSQDSPQLQTRELHITDRRLPEKTHNMEEIIKKENPFEAAEAMRAMAIELQLPLDAVPEMDEEVSHNIYFLHSDTQIQPQPGIDPALQDVIENPGKIDNLVHDDGKVVCILQFNRRLSVNELIELLETNTRVLDEEIGMMSFIIKTHVDNLEQLNSLPYVRGIHYYAPEYKISFAKQPRGDGAARIYLFGSDLQYYEQVLSTYGIQVRTHLPSGNFFSVNLERGQYDVLAESHWWIRSIVELKTPSVDGFTDNGDTSMTLPSVQDSNRSNSEKSNGVSITVNSHPHSTGQTMYLWDFNDDNPKELSPNVSFTPGTTVRLMATANIGFPYVFKKWELVTQQSLNINNLGTNEGGLIEITIPDEDVELTAHFRVYNHQPEDSRTLVSAFSTNYSGENVNVGVYDGGIWLESSGLVNTDLPAESVTVFENADNNNDHGTHVSGIIASRGTRDLSCEHNAKGVSPGVDLFVGPLSSPTEDVYNFFALHDVYLSNHSWGYQSNFTYEDDAKLFDDLSRDDNHIFVKSSGNWGNNITAPGTGKNVITVGSINHYTEDGSRFLAEQIGDKAGYSNHGPTLDGRLKPELVAPGGIGTRARGIVSNNIPDWEVRIGGNLQYLDHLMIPQQGTIDDDIYRFPEWPEDDFYMRMSGTSMAAPHVTGSIAQMIEAFYGDDLDDFNSEMIKAVLINNTIPLKQNISSSPLSGYASNTIGYGLLNTFSNIHYIQDEMEPILNDTGQLSYSYLTGGGSDDWELEVEPGTVKLVVTLAYNDRSGISSFQQNEPLKNRLDLSITSPSGVTESYTLPDGVGVTEKSPLQKVVIEDPEAGEWIATVDFTSAYGTSPLYNQTYAIVADAIYKTPELELTTDNTSLTVPAGGQFQLNPEVTNTGGYIAAGVTLAAYEESLFEADWVFGGNANRTFYVGNLLYEGHSANKVLTIRAPENPGTYTLIVEADGINMEFDTNEYPKKQEITVIVTEPVEPQNVEIAICLDRSGSMQGGYMTAAKNASKTFVDMMQFNDYLAVTSFANSASVNYPFAQLVDEQDKTNAKNAINNISASGMTAIGAGLQVSQSELNKGNTAQKQAIILLSDGYENQSPYVSAVLPTIPGNTDIYTIALGPESDQTLLNNIAVQTGGVYSYAPGADRLNMIYNSIRAKVTGQELYYSTTENLDQGQTQSHNVNVDGGTTFVIFNLTWTGDELNIELMDPDGVVIDQNTTDPNISFTSGPSYKTFSITNPVSGEYVVAISNPNKGRQSTNYNLTVSGESTLTMNVAFNKSIYGLNEPIQIVAEINDDYLPVTGATVTAEVTVPAKADFIPKGLISNEEPESGLPLEYDHKTGNYYGEKGELRYEKTTLVLNDNGDGTYSNYFTNTTAPGSYSFDVSASGLAPLSGNFTRIDNQSTNVTTNQSIVVTAPQTDATWEANSHQTVVWSSTNIGGNVDIHLSTNGGSSYDIPLALDTPDVGSLSVLVPNMPSNTCRIRVRSVVNHAVAGINPGNFTIETPPCAQAVNIKANWSLISSYIEPGDPALGEMFSEIIDDVVIMIGKTGIYWPGQNINTIGAWDCYLGYKIKMNAPGMLCLNGEMVEYKEVNLTNGINYLPVLSETSVQASTIFDQIEDELLFAFDMDGLIYWPDGGIFDLQLLEPGKGYMLSLTADASVTFPESGGGKQLNGNKIRIVENSPWEVTNTGNPHIISIFEAALTDLKQGDIIAAFNTQGVCVGVTQFADEAGNLPLVVYGDDLTTELVDGLVEGEAITLKVYDPLTQNVTEVYPVWDNKMPNIGQFAENGLSAIMSLKAGTAVSEPSLSNLSIYPNPNTGAFNVTGINEPVEIHVVNTTGQVIEQFNTDQSIEINLSGLAKGIYYLKVVSETNIRVEKIIIR